MFAPPPPAKKSWAVDILTTDYLLSGTLDGDRNPLAFQPFGGDFQSIVLTGARMTSTGTLAVPDSLTAPWVVAYSDAVVAIIPRDAGSLEYAMKRGSDSKFSQKAEIFVGPYLVRGLLCSPANDVRTLAAFSTGFIVQQASISSLLPGARLTGLSAPYALFTGQHKHFVRPVA